MTFADAPTLDRSRPSPLLPAAPLQQVESGAQPQARPAFNHRVGIFNVKYSPNLGDGIIAQCLEGELRRADPQIVPTSIDLAGRGGFDTGHGKHRARLLSLIERLPRPLRARLVPALLVTMVRLRLTPRWQAKLGACDSVVIGGGALFQDVDQNFPIKLAEALRLANARGLPVAVASVGVTGHWSQAGRRRLVSRLKAARIVGLSVRDTASAGTWQSVIGVGEAAIAPDPGLLAAYHYGLPATEPRTRPRVGLCVTAPLALRLHHEGAHDDRHLEVWTTALARQLSALGNDVVLFTNGSPEDRLFRDRIRARLGDDPAIRFAPDFAVPQDLAHCLAACDCVMAHRLHACIVAYSYRVPTVGFAWDGKLRSFFEQTGRDDFVIDPREASPPHTAELAVRAMAQGVDPQLHGELLDRAGTAIHTLAGQLVGAR